MGQPTVSAEQLAARAKVEVRQITPMDSELAEEWLRETEDSEVAGVGAQRWADDGLWIVDVWAMEFVREEPLEGEIRRAVDAALRSVPGVTSVYENDRENWGVEGTPEGAALVRAVAAEIDLRADRIRSHIDAL